MKYFKGKLAREGFFNQSSLLFIRVKSDSDDPGANPPLQDRKRFLRFQLGEKKKYYNGDLMSDISFPLPSKYGKNTKYMRIYFCDFLFQVSYDALSKIESYPSATHVWLCKYPNIFIVHFKYKLYVTPAVCPARSPMPIKHLNDVILIFFLNVSTMEQDFSDRVTRTRMLSKCLHC